MARVLVGVDDSLIAGTTVRWASRLAAATGAEVILVNAWLAPTEITATDEHEEELAVRSARLDRLWSRSADNEGVDVRSAVFEGDPREVLLEVARGEAVDLLVVGRAAQGGERPGLLHLGSVVEYLAHAAACPMAVIPAEAATQPPERITVGVDGSDESAGAVEWCAATAAATGATVTAVNVQAPMTERNPVGTPDDWLHFVAQQEVPTWAEPITRAGAPLTPVAVRNGRPADGLLAAAVEHEADLLVVGARGLGGFSGLRIGGTAMGLLHRAELPLVVVPTP